MAKMADPNDEEEKEKPLQNNLKNIKNENEIYKSEDSRLTRYLSGEMKALFQAVKEAPIAAADFYYLLYSINPQTADKNSNEFLESMRSVLVQMVQNPGVQELRKETMLNEEKSTEYTAAIMRELLRDMQKSLEEQQKQQGQHGYGQNEKSVSELVKEAMEGDEYSKRQLEELLKEMEQSGEGEKLAQKLKEILSKGKSELDKEVEDMKKEEQEKLRQQLQQQGQQGQGQQGQGQQGQGQQKQGQGSGAGKGASATDAETKNYDTKKVDSEDVKKIEALTKKIVKAMPEFSSGKVKMPNGDRISGLTKTKNIAKAFLRELAMPEEMLFAKAFEGWTTFEKFTSFKGNFHILMDRSSSMDEEQKTIWARSVALALQENAIKHGRKFDMRFFNTETSEVLDKQDDIKDKLKRVESSGGTEIAKAVRLECEAIINDNKLKSASNTIVLITDGEDNVSALINDGTLQKLKDNKIKLITIMIGEKDNELLKRISTEYMKVKPNDKNALELIKEVVKNDDKDKKKQTPKNMSLSSMLRDKPYESTDADAPTGKRRQKTYA